MKKESVHFSLAALALIPVWRFIRHNSPWLFTMLSIGICVFFLLRGLYFRLCRTEQGHRLLRKIPFFECSPGGLL